MQRETGTIKFFQQIGWGFVIRDEHPGDDAFLHFSGIRDEGKYRTVNEGDRVEFEIIQSDRGPQAVDLIVLTPVGQVAV